MLYCFASTVGSDAATRPRRRPLASQEQSGAFGTGSWTDTSPRNGCRIATLVAIWELAANAAASDSSLTVVSAQELAVPVQELVDFVRHNAAIARAHSIRK
jgi:hypothetical protein